MILGSPDSPSCPSALLKGKWLHIFCVEIPPDELLSTRLSLRNSKNRFICRSTQEAVPGLYGIFAPRAVIAVADARCTGIPVTKIQAEMR